jgi:predicted permease
MTAALKNEITVPGRTRFDLRRALVVFQVALSLLLLIGAGLFVRSLRNLRTLDAGFDRERVLLVDVNPQQLGYKGQRLRTFYDRLIARLRESPQVRAASLANITPQGGSMWNQDVTVQGYKRPAEEKPYLNMNAVSPGFFASLGIPVLLGRDFREADNPVVATDEHGEEEALGPPAPVAIINETMAKKYWAGQSPLGGRFSLAEEYNPAKSFEVVGVVKDAQYYNLREGVESMIYFPVWRFGAGGNTICLRSVGDAAALAGWVRREVNALDAQVPVLGTKTMEQQFDDVISQERTVSSLCGFFGALAALLSAVGRYGGMAHSVTRRYREIGIRLALGAEPGSVLRLVLRDTAIMIGLGALIGLPLALALTRLVKSFLYGLTPQDPASIALATVGLVLVTGLAGYLPARRATRIEPTSALRYD